MLMIKEIPMCPEKEKGINKESWMKKEAILATPKKINKTLQPL